jgi:hypothetical protein
LPFKCNLQRYISGAVVDIAFTPDGGRMITAAGLCTLNQVDP